jgi:hypothetical protein
MGNVSICDSIFENVEKAFLCLPLLLLLLLLLQFVYSPLVE